MCQLLKKFSFNFTLIILFFFINKCFLYAGGIIDSGHNILLQKSDTGLKALEGKLGACSFCHIPHQASGQQMPNIYGGDSTFSSAIGEVGILCQKCHGVIAGYADAPIMTKTIFLPDNVVSKYNHPLVDNNTDIYADKIYDTVVMRDSKAMGNMSGNTYGGTIQWMSAWPGTSRTHTNRIGDTTIECTSCHDVHSVSPGITFKSGAKLDGTGASGEFLRAKPFDKNSDLNNQLPFDPKTGLNKKQIFCEYCHVGRATAGWGPYNSVSVEGYQFSTHPVGSGYYATNKKRDVRDDNKGWESSVIIPDFLMANDSTIALRDINTPMGHLGGLVKSSEIGYEVSKTSRGRNGVVICQTCHKVHGGATSGQSHDGGDITDYKSMLNPETPDVLAIDNNSSSGYNKLCENCHSYKPFLRLTAHDSTNGDPERKGHPLKHNKVGSYNHDSDWSTTNMVMVACEDSDSPSGTYGVNISEKWPTGGSAGDNEIVCLSCHDVHGAVKKTKLLRAMPLCNECHKAPPSKLGISHPVNVTLKNTDNEYWPDQANLTLFTPQVFDGKQVVLDSQPIYSDLVYTSNSNYKDNKANPIVKIGCDTCHDWTNGNIHYEVARRRDVQLETKHLETGDEWYPDNLRYSISNQPKSNEVHLHGPNEDPNHNSELCVSCHTKDIYNYNSTGITVTGEAKNEASEGLGGAGANPSPYIREYPVALTGVNLALLGTQTMEEKGIDRLGTHSAQLRVVEDESYGGKIHENRLSWVYWQYWGDTTSVSEINKKNLDPYYKNSGGKDIDACAKMVSKKRSKWGQRFDSFNRVEVITQDKLDADPDKYNPVIICQSCHTPHNAAAGLVEYNSAAGGGNMREPTPHTALLYATQAESFMCRVCHQNGGDIAHPVNKPSVTLANEGTYGVYRGRESNVYFNGMDIVADTTTITETIWLSGEEQGTVKKRKGVAQSELPHKLVLTWDDEYSRPGGMERMHLRDTTTIYGIRWKVSNANGPGKPSNYPRKGGSLNNRNAGSRGLPGEAVDSSMNLLTCDSCHAPHSAGTPMGTFILEGNDDRLPNQTSIRIASAGGSINGAAQPTMTDDSSTCILCHMQ